MRIDTLHLDSFGKFQQTTIAFHDGLNTVCADNEAGKSTIAAFIRAMLYGFGDSRGKEISDRERYRNWESGRLEGRLDCTVNGRAYTIARSAGATKRSDKTAVYDRATGELLSLLPEDLVAVGAEMFDRTLFIRQLGTRFSGGTAEITARLSNLMESGDESVNFDAAMKRLEDARRQIQLRRGKGGALEEVTQRIRALEAERADNERSRAALLDERFRLGALTAQKAEAEAAYEAALAEQEEAQKQQLYNAYHAAAQELDEAHTALAAAQKDVQAAEDARAALSRRHRGWIACVLLLAATGVLYAFVGLPYAIAAAAVALFVLGFTALQKHRLLRLANDALAAQNELCARARDHLLEREQRHSACETEILTRYGALEELAAAPITQKYDSAACSRALVALTAQHSALEQKLQSATCRPLGDIDGELEALREEAAVLTARLAALDRAIDALRGAYNELQSRFSPQVCARASEYLCRLTGGKHEEMLIGNDFSVHLHDGVPKPSALYSGGTVDQVYLCLRLALAELLFEDAPPLILDDPFLQYDPTRRGRALELLEGLAKERQILLFSCLPLPEFAQFECEILTA